MSDRRRRRRRPGGSDRSHNLPRDDFSPQDREPQSDREPWAEYESHADRDAPAESEEAAGFDDAAAEPAGEETVADALAEYERRRDELIRARREERNGRPSRSADRSAADRSAADRSAEKRPGPSRDRDEEPDQVWDNEKTVEGRGISPARRGLGTPRRNPMLTAAMIEADDDETDDFSAGAEASVHVPASYRSDECRGYSLRTPREVRRDGPIAWTLRGYRRFRRQLRQNLTAYGHRYNTVGANAATDAKPALLWLVDFPRLVGMWISHIDYRTTRAVTLTFRDLRSRPTRIPFSAAETLSPHVAFVRPTYTDLNPFWRWPAVREWTREFRNDWRHALSLAAAGAGAAVAGAKEEFSAELSAVGDRTGRGLAWTQAQATRFDSLFRPTGRNDDRAWWFACGSGVCGLILTAVLFLQGEPAVAEVNAVAALNEPKTPLNPVPDAALEPEQEDFDAPADELFGGEAAPWGTEQDDPDPTLIARGETDPAVESDTDPWNGHGNPFADMGEPGDLALDPAPESYVRPLPELTIDLRRAEPDFGEDLPGYEPPDDDTPAETAAAPVRTRLPADPGGWDEERRRSEPTAPVLPAEYIGVEPGARSARRPVGPDETPDASFDDFSDDFPDDFGAAAAPNGDRWLDDEPAADDALPAPADVPADGVPAAAGAGLTVTRSAPASAALGVPFTYELWVKNEGDAPVAAVLEEAVGPGVRVTDAEPPASFLPAEDVADELATAEGPGGGLLSWDFAALPPGAVRRLSVTVHPLPSAVGGGEEEVSFTTDARVTGRWAVAGSTVVMAPPEPEPEPLPEPPSEPTEPWERDWPSDPPPPVDDFDFPADPLDEPALDEPEPEPPVEEPEPTWDPEVTWEPQPLPDPEIQPAQILRPEPEPEPAFELEPEPEPQPEPIETDDEPAAAPRLRVTLAGPRGVRAGEDVRLTVTVSNEGDGPAEAVAIDCPVPERLRHPGGKQVRCLLGALEPGEVRTASFIARAVDPGPARPELTVTARGGLSAAVTTPLTVRPAVVCR